MSGKQSRRESILTEPVLPLLIKMSIPTIIGMLINMLYNLTDTFFVGRLNNKSMTAAILSSIGVVMALVTGFILMMILTVWVRPLAGLIGGNASPQLLDYTAEYLRIILFSVPYSLFGLTVYNQLRLCGSVRDGMIVFLIIAAMVLAIYAKPVAAVLSKDEEVVNLSALILRLQCISLPFLGFYAVSSMFMQNIGQYSRALWISIARQGIFYIPLLFLFPAIGGQIGLFLVQPAADILATGFAAGVLIGMKRRDYSDAICKKIKKR